MSFRFSINTMIKRYCLIFVMLAITFIANAQNDGSAKQKIKKAEQKKEEIAKRKQRSEVEGKKRHEALQTKAVRKRMHKHRKERIHVDAYERKPFFLKRWFHKKEH